MSLTSLKFKSSVSALEYVEKYFTTNPLKENKSFIGIVKKMELEDSSIIENIERKDLPYVVEIIISKGVFRKNIEREFVLGICKDEKVALNIKINDLVEWTAIEKVKQSSAVYKKNNFVGIISKIKLPEIDVETGQFSDKQLIDEHNKVANNKISKKISKEAKIKAFDILKGELESRYEAAIKNCSFLKDGKNIFVFFRNGEREISTFWSIHEERWINKDLNINSSSLTHVNREEFENVVFAKEDKFQYEKTSLVELFMSGISKGSSKKISITLNNGSKLSLSFSCQEWNDIVMYYHLEVDKTYLKSLNSLDTVVYKISVDGQLLRVSRVDDEGLSDVDVFYGSIKETDGFYLQNEK